MRIVVVVVTLIFLTTINGVLAGGGGGKHHVHFKIHVPDIIKHHVHTKTVFVHVHHPNHHHHHVKKTKKVVPKKKETHNEESHHEDWSSWSSYDSHGGHGNGHDHKQHAGHETPTHGGFRYGGPSSPEDHGHGTNYPPQHKLLSHHDAKNHMNIRSQYFGDNLPHPLPHATAAAHENILSPSAGDYNDPSLVGYSYPPQYGASAAGITHQGMSNNGVSEPDDNYSDIYEEGYRKGLHSQSGHVLSEDLKKFYDNKFEEVDSSKNEHDFDSHKDFDDSSNIVDNNLHSSDYDGFNNNNQYQNHGDGYFSAVMDTR